MSEENIENALKPKILTIALEEAIVEYLCETFKVEWLHLNSEEEFQNRFEEFNDGVYECVICGSELGLSFSYEVSQLFTHECPKTPIFYASGSMDAIDKNELEKNGFKKIFLFPIDKIDLDEEVSELLDPSLIEAKRYKPVRLVDIEPEGSLSFDTFVQLPLNRKFVRFSKKEIPLGERRFGRLTSHEVSTVFVQQHEFKKFYKYTADRISRLSGEDAFETKTEKQKDLEKAVRGLFIDLFDRTTKGFDDGKVAMDNCKKVISTYITGGQNENLYRQLLAAVGLVSGQYSHASAVSVIAALIGMGVGYECPEDLAFAGFFHDISLWDKDESLRFKADSELSKEELEEMQRHPEKSLEFVSAKKIILSEDVMAIIKQHHERYDGEGFPKRREGSKIHHGAQILSFADQLEYLTCFYEGKKRFSLQEAFDQIKNNGSVDPALMGKIQPLLPAEDLKEGAA